jgi:uncharacterized protein YegJ (DUF2314 family)
MVRSLQLITLLIVCMIFTASCAASPTLEGTPVTDEEFDAAVKEAHGTLSTLRTALLSPRDSYIFVGLKVRFTGQGEYEDIWTEPVDYFDGYFTTRMIDGVLLNSNSNADRLVSVSLSDVIDWVIVEEDGNLIGGYTIRLSYDHMTPEEKVEFLKVTGYKIE